MCFTMMFQEAWSRIVCRRVLSETYPLSKYGAKIHKIIDICQFLGTEKGRKMQIYLIFRIKIFLYKLKTIIFRRKFCIFQIFFVTLQPKVAKTI